MFAVVDVLISSASYVGSSGGPPAFLFFARGVSTAGVSSSSDVFSIHKLPVLSAERKNPSLKGTAFLVRLVLTCVDSTAKPASPPPLMVSSASLSSPDSVRLPHWAHKMATYTRTCNCHQTLLLPNGPLDALSARVPIWLRPRSFPCSSYSGALTRLNVASSSS